MPSGSAPTLGWDTVFAAHIDDLNKVISACGASPKFFSATDTDDAISMTGEFGTWQIVPGGSGGLLRMKVPFHNAVLTTNGKAQEPLSGAASVEVRLRFLDQNAAAAGSARTLTLTVQPNAEASGEPAVSVRTIDYDGQPPGFGTKLKIETLLGIWMNENVGQFQHAFAAVDINKSAAHENFQWLQPTHVDYAYSDLGPDDGLLAVLCMTENRPPGALAQQVVAGAIPTDQRAGFLISKHRLLDKLVLPIMPYIFQDSRTTDFSLSESGESIITTSQTVGFTLAATNGENYKAQLTSFQLSLQVGEITLIVVAKTEVSPGIFAWFRVENFLSVRLKSISGKQTLEFYDTMPQVVTKWTTEEEGFTLAENILILISILGLAVASFATAGTALAVGALVVGLLAGAAAGGILLTKSIIKFVGTSRAPTIDALLINSTSPIAWTGADGFALMSAPAQRFDATRRYVSFEVLELDIP